MRCRSLRSQIIRRNIVIGQLLGATLEPWKDFVLLA